MKITRHFTREGQSPYADIPFRAAPAGGGGRGTALQIPAAYSRAAADTLAQIACRREGVPAKLKKITEDGVPEWLWRAEADESALARLEPEARFSAETDARQVFNRLSAAWTYSGWKNGYFSSERDARAFHDEICYMLAAQYAAPNAAQWRHTGLYRAYGIKAPAAAGAFAAAAPAGEQRQANSGGDWSLPFAYLLTGKSGAADITAAPQLWLDCARAAQFGAAAGCNISAFSGEEQLANLLKAGEAALASGQSGRACRPAAIAVLSAGHADIEAYIDAGAQAAAEKAALSAGRQALAKHAEAIIAAASAAAGASGQQPEESQALDAAVAAALQDGADGAYLQRLIRASAQGWGEMLRRQIQRAAAPGKARAAADSVLRRAVSLPRGFMRAVEHDEDWTLAPRAGDAPAAAKSLKARRLWDKIAYASWAGGAPELQFHATANEWHSAPAAGAINASSADSAFWFADETACAAFTLNLSHFAGAKNSFDCDAFVHAVRLWVIAADSALFTALFPSAETARRSCRYRPAALGYANLAALLMASGIAYDSDAGRAFCAAATALMTGAAYVASAELAAELGAFHGYAGSAPAMLRAARNRRRAAYGQMRGYEKLSVSPAPLKAAQCPNAELAELARAAWDKALRMGEIYGFRNAQLSALSAEPAACALLDCDAAGTAPLSRLVKFKQRPDGAPFKIISRAVPQALAALGCAPAQAAAVSAYLTGAADLESAPVINSAALRAKGFDDSVLKRLAAALPNASSLRAVFSSAVAGGEFCRKILNFSAEETAKPEFDMLKALGFSAEEIARAESFLCGAASIDGAPHLPPEHYAVFACAGSLSWASQIRMMAAAQAFLCGGISHNLLLPAAASVEDCAKAAMMAWKCGLKSIAVSRGGEQLPESFAVRAGMRAALPLAAKDETQAAPPRRPAEPPAEKEEGRAFAEAGRRADVLPKTERERLPSRRRGYTQTAVIGKHKVYLHTGEFKDGRLGEIFIDMPKESAAFRAVMNNFAAAVSLGLQYGVPLEAYVDSFAFSKFEPAGLVRGNAMIKNASSVPDYVFRELAVSYLGRQDLANIQVSDSSETALSGGEEEMRLIPAGWKRGFELKSNIAAPLPAPAKPAESAAASSAEAEQSDERGGAAPFDIVFSQFGQYSSGSAYAAHTELSAPAQSAAAAQRETPPETAEQSRPRAAAPAAASAYRSAARPIPSYSPLQTPFSNPDYFAKRPAPAEALPPAPPPERTEETRALWRLRANAADSFTIAAPRQTAEKAAALNPAKPGEEHLEGAPERSLIDELFDKPAAAHETNAYAAAKQGAETPPERSVKTAPARGGESFTAAEDTARAAGKERAAGRSMPGYTGDMCPECHNFTMLRSGAALKCDICGAVLNPSAQDKNSAPSDSAALS